ncbi:hypothetical protein LNV08_05245 [Paucibacter sp. TC2R-5]|uniref:hypothetical protein n=1 Tax=Paucibacter sp. TC2R-5 TaxID=2893555 RepID=UPI0021E44FE2|nr:hypothetical protein [Paucibacter sp. TC2R-5]MCV2358375.1 hypothetical protein [Paucibacter sp. TC2R-5]
MMKQDSRVNVSVCLRPAAWGLLALACAGPALSGRPLSSDDAATADPGSCQLEGWGEKVGSSRALVLAPACGIVEGLEIDVDYTHPHPRDEIRGESGFAVKWAPKSWGLLTSAGQINFGLKAGVGFERPSDSGWRRNGQGLLGLATLVVNEDFALHANLGPHQDRASGLTGTALNLALVWVPSPMGLLFAEVQSNDRRSVFGGTQRTMGGLWWVTPDKLGLSLTVGQQAGSSQMQWTLGFGWYGLTAWEASP